MPPREEETVVRVIKGVKYYPVSQRIQFGLESMYEKARYMIECERENLTAEQIHRWHDIADECSRLAANMGWLSGKDYGRAKELTVEREFMRYSRCLASGMSERDAGQALG